ncbi:replicative DNA helicase [Helicobacter cholecystus]|uniref:Replicative DNA helicase n=1 Tax=Helicobacter cholecystus TaxID=45498 RepID=A0A3D8IW39_9HELI|nr:replicative DNA helicase [Helicobacter cholecystus]RDU69509.1 replicative DNA helicase [Helicobacter cholecystus]VEJ24062.1 replicative DNA helicase [Helicobacter cholecystus]
MEGLGLQNIERTILATLFFNANYFDDVAEVIGEKDFLDPFHQLLFSAIRKQVERGEPAGADIIKSLVSSDRRFDENALLYILTQAPASNPAFYASLIKNASLKRDLHEISTYIAQNANNDEVGALEMVEEIEKRVFDLSLPTENRGFKNSEKIVEDTMRLLTQYKERGNNFLTGLNTGFAELNKLTTGFNGGELIIIGARPSMGKTTFVLNMVQKFLSTAKGVAFFSLEMQAEHLMLRMFSSLTSTPLQRMRIGDLSDEEWSALSSSANLIASECFFIDDNPNLSITQLRSKVRKLKLQFPDIGVVVVDYLQLMRGSKSLGGEGKRQEEVSEISRGLKLLAREMNIPIIALSQLNRGLENRDDKRPQLSDLRESGSIEQDADVILFLYREDVYRKREEKAKEEKAKKENINYVSNYQEREIEPAEIIVAKNRNGEVKHIKIQFNKPFIRFEDISVNLEENFDPKDYKSKFDGAVSSNFSMPRV